MAHQWFLQHGGKQYGPLTSAQLKKLAGDGKITPVSQIRLGAEGVWGPASRVQGLFPAPPLSPPPSLLDDLDALPPAPPMPPPVDRPLARLPLGTVRASQTPKQSPPVAGKLVGAVGIIFGTLALATFWLPLLSTPLGWTGIIVGAMGLLIGFAGLIVAARQGGSGLYLNVAAASSSVVGLVLTAALMLTLGKTTTPAPAPVAIVPPVVVEPPSPAPQPVAAEPEPPPEPVWTDSDQSIDQGPLRISLAEVAVADMLLEGNAFASTVKRTRAKKLRVVVKFENRSTDRIVQVPGWSGLAAGASGLGELVAGSELGKQLGGATATATLVDNIENNYPQTSAMQLGIGDVDLSADPSVRPGQTAEKLVLFDPPLDSIQYLRLLLPPSGFGGSEPLRFQIARDKIRGLPAPPPDVTLPAP